MVHLVTDLPRLSIPISFVEKFSAQNPANPAAYRLTGEITVRPQLSVEHLRQTKMETNHRRLVVVGLLVGLLHRVCRIGAFVIPILYHIALSSPSLTLRRGWGASSFQNLKIIFLELREGGIEIRRRRQWQRDRHETRPG